MNDEEMRDLFREMREDPLPADSLARVRARVQERIQQPRWMSPWKVAAAVALAGCLAAAFLMLRPGKTVPPVSAPVIAQARPPAETAPPAERPVARVERPRRARPRSQPQRAETVPVSIRIETPDPSVVILLVN